MCVGGGGYERNQLWSDEKGVCVRGCGERMW